MRRTQIGLTALIAIAGAALAGCGTARLTPPGASGATGATPAVNKAAPGPPAGSRAAALRLAHQMLSRVALPPGSRPYSGPLPPALRPPGISASGGPESAGARMVWQVPASMDITATFIKAHIPGEMRKSGQGGLSDASGVLARQVDVTPRSLPPGIDQADMTLEVAPGAQGGSVVRGDSDVIWYPPRSAAEHVPAGMHAATITATLRGPRPHTITRTFTSGPVIAKLAGMLNGMHAAPMLTMSCPAGLASYRVAFAAARGQRPVLTAATGACLSLTVTAHGKQQPALWDPGNRLITEAGALLGIKPA